VSFLRRLFGSSSGEDAAGRDDAVSDDGTDGGTGDSRPSVTAWVRLSEANFENEREQARVFSLENAIIAAVDEQGVGSYDTNELARGSFGMRVVGDDPDRLVEVLRPLLATAPAGSFLTVRRGPPGTSEERVELNEDERRG
jgi:hypothetical protein